MDFEIRCPKCRGLMAAPVGVDRGDPELRDESPIILQILKCNRCGFTKTRILDGLPDEKERAQWALEESVLIECGEVQSLE